MSRKTPPKQPRDADIPRTSMTPSLSKDRLLYVAITELQNALASNLISIYDTTISKRTSDASEGITEVNGIPTKKRTTGIPVRPRTSHSQSSVFHTEIRSRSTPSSPHALTPLGRQSWVDTRVSGLLRKRDASTTRSTSYARKSPGRKSKMIRC